MQDHTAFTAAEARTRARTEKLILYDGLASEAMGTLTTGVFLTGVAVALNVSNTAIGVLAAVPFFVQLLQLPAAVIVERWRKRRTICVLAAATGRCFLLGSALLPFLDPVKAVILLILMLAVYQGLGAIGGCAWNSWMRDLVPETEYGRFFGRRTVATTALATALALVGSVLVDRLNGQFFPGRPVIGYAVLFVLSALIGLYGVYLLSITPDQPMAPVEQSLHPLALLAAPFRDTNFRRLIVFLASWAFAANLAAPFFAVYMMKSLGYPLRDVIALTVASQLSNLGSLGIWGVLIDRFSNKAVLEISAPLFLLCVLGWTFTGLSWAGSYTFAILFVIHALMGIATAGVALASNNIAMKLSPGGQATAYLAASSVATASCAALAPILGGLGADFFAVHQLNVAVNWSGGKGALSFEVLSFHGWTFFFGIACVAGLYSLHRLSFIEEESGSSDRLVLREWFLEARRSLHSLSSAAGLLRVVRSPLSLLQQRSG
ncbi:MAG TPA: MFS transporter [Stellaceae bacterium]|jgi:MFS family permease|nr:MFS transporter [Stellaceae bacterium]